MMDNPADIAARLIDQRGEPLGRETARLHYWRDKAITAANELSTPAPPTQDMVELRERIADLENQLEAWQHEAQYGSER